MTPWGNLAHALLFSGRAEIPPEQYPDMNCDALNTERTRLQVNWKLYTMAKVSVGPARLSRTRRHLRL
jgi:hypothetical protein